VDRFLSVEEMRQLYREARAQSVAPVRTRDQGTTVVFTLPRDTQVRFRIGERYVLRYVFVGGYGFGQALIAER
jgi:hypothetical protein